jgi:subfamily B ATP-binding cassette protein MsbA
MNGLWALRGYTKRHWKGLLLAFFIMAATAGLNAGVIAKAGGVFRGLFDSLPDADPATQATVLAQIHWRLLVLLGAVVLAALGQGGSVFMGDWLSQKVLFALRTDVFQHLQSLALRFYENRRSGELVSRVNNDTTVLQSVLGPSITELVVAPLTALAAVGYMVSLVMAFIGPSVALLTQQLGVRLRRYSHQVQSRLADLTANVEESFSLIRVIKIFGLARVMERRFDGGAREVYRSEMRSSRMKALNAAIVGLFTGLALCGVLYFGAGEIVAKRMTPGTTMVFIMAMVMAGNAINQAARVVMALSRGEASATRTLELLDEIPEIQDSPDAQALTALEGDIRFENVTFAYEPDRPVLRGMDLHIAPGEKVALVGPSGAGKTTIAGLVPRLYDTQGGHILIDGQDIRQITQESLRSFMGFVPQETLLFAGTIGENIAFARPEASQEEIRAAARAANAADFIEALPEGYRTQVGERGVKLSGGQQQRIAISRALLRNPRILILDEATSSLDQTSEQMVHQALRVLMQGRTALIIAHRLSTIRDADRILVINDGRIVEEGTHDQLMARGGLYWNLYQSRLAQDEPEGN